MRWLVAGLVGLFFGFFVQASSFAAFYTVRKGDSLIKISKELGVKPRVLKALNPHVRWLKIRPGEKIVVPDTRGVIEYRIKKGDTLVGIARRFGIKRKLIAAYNPHVNWLKIRPGEKIVVPLVKSRSGRVEKKIFRSKKINKAINAKASGSSSSLKKSVVYRGTVRKGSDYIELSSLLDNNGIKSLNPDIDWASIVRPELESLQKKQFELSTNTEENKDTARTANPKKHRKAARELKKLLKGKHLKPGEVGDGFYVVARGDTLSSIASRFGLTLKQLEELNPGKGRLIKPGDIIVIPGELSEKIMLSRKEGLYLPVKYLMYSEPYRVKRGDSLWKIARKFNTRVYLLKMLNNLNSNRLKVGSIIFVPEKNLPGLNRLKLEYSILQNRRRALASYAERFLGRPYRFGGDSLIHGIDCSAFVQKIFGKFGYRLPRTAEEQYLRVGVRVPLSRIKVGDLLFFHTMGYAHVTHVGIYIGHNRFIHAAGRRSGVKISRLNSYYRKRLVAVKRVFGVSNKYVYNRHRSR